MAVTEQQLVERLEATPALWTHWGFESWSQGPLTGVFRRQLFIKGGILGRIAEYGARDYIIWHCGSPEDREQLWRNLKPLPEIMTQRVLFVRRDERPARRIKSFWFGFRGYLEFFSYWPGDDLKINPAPADLTGLVELALNVKEKGA